MFRYFKRYVLELCEAKNVSVKSVYLLNAHVGPFNENCSASGHKNIALDVCSIHQCDMLCWIDKWSPALQIRTVLLSIQALLSAPNPDDPLANDVAEQWKKHESQAIETGWTPIALFVIYSKYYQHWLSHHQHFITKSCTVMQHF